MIPSSPVRTADDARRKTAKRREEQARAEKEAAAVIEAQETTEVCQEVLRYLANHERTFGDLVAYISDGQNYAGNARYWGFFSVDGRVERVLDTWVSSQNSKTGRECVHEWAVEYVKRVVHTEGDAATRSKLLQTSAMEIDESFALDFSLGNLHARLRKLCPTAMSVLEAFSTTTRQAREMKEASQKRKNNVRDPPTLLAHYPSYYPLVCHNRSLDSSWGSESEQQLCQTCSWTLRIRLRSAAPSHQCPLPPRTYGKLPSSRWQDAQQRGRRRHSHGDRLGPGR